MNGPITITSQSRAVQVDVTSTPRVYQVGVTTVSREVEVVTVTRNMGPTGKSAYDIVVENGYTGTQAEWAQLMMGMIYVTQGPKSSAVDGGVFPQISITDDYLYVLVTPGAPGAAKWKKVVMFYAQ